MTELVLTLSIVTACISFSVSETKLFEPLRNWISARSSFCGELVKCPYCFGHWVSLALVLIYQPRIVDVWLFLDLAISVFVIAWLGAFQALLMCRLMDLVEK
ncbi:MAG: hypothetical protein CMO55_17215 [Verrucomicrobiales bacterium]|nr:hypothetical protein [Verrucomicrobiales bacterium]